MRALGLSLGLFLALPAFAQDAPTCAADLVAPPESFSVAWISPVGQTVRAGKALPVVPTKALRGWVRRDQPSLARFLQRVGVRRSAKPPRRAYKVVVFDVDAPRTLCRPVSAMEEGGEVAGLPVCEERLSKPRNGEDGCGHTLDRATGQPGLPMYRATWRDLVRNGFCVLPAEHFLEAP